jgi:hypothetical protein
MLCGTVPTMGYSAIRWRQSVEPHFGFLADVGFSTVTEDESSNWQTWLQYASAESAVRVARSVEFDRVELHLYRLLNGELPPYSEGTVGGIGYHALFDNVMESRGQRSIARGGLAETEIERQLGYWSDSLRRVAPEFLSGDLSAIDEAAVIVDERKRKHPWPPPE